MYRLSSWRLIKPAIYPTPNIHCQCSCHTFNTGLNVSPVQRSKPSVINRPLFEPYPNVHRRMLMTKHAGLSNPERSKSLDEYVRQHWDNSITEDNETVRSLLKDLWSGSRAALARCITLVESRNPTHKAIGEQILVSILAKQQKKLAQDGPESLIFRIGISGSPGVGKSSLLETLGMYLVEDCNLKIAVLTVDPSSVTTGGSLLGDITRMPDLSRHPNAYIRSSPTRGTLGGVTIGTREAIILCEGAGYDVVLIETVGVGQSEIAISDITDMFVLLLSPSQGDEVQGMKRGIMEMCDLLLVTKADGALAGPAKHAQAEYVSALKFMRSRWGRLWKPPVLTWAHSHTKAGIADAWTEMQNYCKTLANEGELLRLRQRQFSKWMWLAVQHQLYTAVVQTPFLLLLQVLRTSAHTKAGIADAWTEMQNYRKTLANEGELLRLRQRQFSKWMWLAVQHQLPLLFKLHPDVLEITKSLEMKLHSGELTPSQAAETLLRQFLRV